MTSEPYVYEPHVWVHPKGGGKAICRRCGLMALNNEYTAWSIRVGCDFDNHPNAKSMRNKYTKKR